MSIQFEIISANYLELRLIHGSQPSFYTAKAVSLEFRLYEALACEDAIRIIQKTPITWLCKALAIAIELAEIVDDAVQVPLNVDFGLAA